MENQIYHVDFDGKLCDRRDKNVSHRISREEALNRGLIHETRNPESTHGQRVYLDKAGNVVTRRDPRVTTILSRAEAVRLGIVETAEA